MDPHATPHHGGWALHLWALGRAGRVQEMGIRFGVINLLPAKRWKKFTFEKKMDVQVPWIFFPLKSKTFPLESLSCDLFIDLPEIPDSFSRRPSPPPFIFNFSAWWSHLQWMNTPRELSQAVLLTSVCRGAFCELPGNGRAGGSPPDCKTQAFKHVNGSSWTLLSEQRPYPRSSSQWNFVPN